MLWPRWRRLEGRALALWVVAHGVAQTLGAATERDRDNREPSPTNRKTSEHVGQPVHAQEGATGCNGYRNECRAARKRPPVDDATVLMAPVGLASP